MKFQNPKNEHLSMERANTLFDDEFLKKLEYLNLISKQMVPGHLHGEHRSKKRQIQGLNFRTIESTCLVRIQETLTGEHF